MSIPCVLRNRYNRVVAAFLAIFTFLPLDGKCEAQLVAVPKAGGTAQNAFDAGVPNAENSVFDSTTLAVEPSSSTLDYISASDLKGYSKPQSVHLRSNIALVFDQRENEVLLQKQADKKVPIASFTKLMIAMVVLDKKLPLDEPVPITGADKDRIRYAKSRLPIGVTLTRYDLLLFALMTSENRTASALARSYPGGKDSFVKAMNQKAKDLGLTNTHFADSSGLRNENVSTASEMLKLVLAADKYELIKTLTTSVRESVTDVKTGRIIEFGNTNRLVKNDDWNISLSKTGFTSEAGNCLVMKTEISHRPLVIVLLNSWGKLSKYGDSNRIKRWLLQTESIIKALKL